MQLKKLGSKFPVPLIIMNYDNFYEGLMQFILSCVRNSSVAAHELTSIILANSNEGEWLL